MLVLTRKTAEMIHVGDNIVIKVISCGRGRVKIGIDAPTSVRVIRGELAESGLLDRLRQTGAGHHPRVVQPVA